MLTPRLPQLVPGQVQIAHRGDIGMTCPASVGSAGGRDAVPQVAAFAFRRCGCGGSRGSPLKANETSAGEPGFSEDGPGPACRWAIAWASVHGTSTCIGRAAHTGHGIR